MHPRVLCSGRLEEGIKGQAGRSPGLSLLFLGARFASCPVRGPEAVSL